jgi:VanZ family protein
LANTRCSTRWLWPLGQAALIFFLSSRPGSDYPDVDVPGLDKAVHFCLYAPLGAGLSYALGPGRALLAWAGSVLWGASDELHQAFVPQRSPSFADLAADAAGAAAGVWVLSRRRATRRMRPVS